MLEIKNILCDVIDYCFPRCDLLNEYKKFYIEICDKNMKTKHGDYNEKNHHIRIFNLYRSDAKIISTTIHELAHHIDWCNRGKSDHSKDFYFEYRQLLYTALNMDILNANDYLESIVDQSDFNKVKKMIDEYIPVPISYNRKNKKIICRNCYEQKDLLKENDYTYNSFNKSWEKYSINVDEEEAFLESIGIECEVVNYGQIRFDKKITIIADEGSFDYKNELKEVGFRYIAKKRRWEFKVEEEECEEILQELIDRFPEVKIYRNRSMR